MKVYWLLFLLYFATRLLNLGSLPIFNDEAIYLHWGQIMVNISGQAYYGMLDGKPPLILWIYGYLQKLPLDPLVAGRLLSILTGFLTLLGVIKICQVLKLSTNVQTLAALLYVFNPLTLFFDRLAILDSPVSTISVWVLYLSLQIQQSKKFPAQYLVLLGAVQGLGLWIKGNTNFFLYLPFLLPLFSLLLNKDWKQTKRETLAFLLSFSLAQILFLPLRSHQLFSQYSKREGDFLMPLTQAILPTNWVPHLSTSSLTILIYLTPLVLLFTLLGLRDFFQKDKKVALFLALSSLLPLGFEVLFAKELLSRYYLFTFLPLLLFAAKGVANFGKWGLPAQVITLALPGIISLSLLINPQKTIQFLSVSQTIKRDMPMYVTSWPSGYGVKEAADWLKSAAQKRPILVITRADSGNPEDAMFVYLAKEKNILLAQAGKQPSEQELAPFKNIAVYFVSRGEQCLDMRDQLEEKQIFKKPADAEFVGIYQVKPQARK